MSKHWKIHASGATKLMANWNDEKLTPNQKEKLELYLKRDADAKLGYVDAKGKKITPVPDGQRKDMMSWIAKMNAPDELPTGAKTFIRDEFVGKHYGNRKSFKSKYTDKGNITEDEAIEMVKEFLKIPFGEKNEERKENDYIIGTCDLYLNNIVFDIKNAYTCHSFPVFNDPLKEVYKGQGQCYMDLWGVKKYMVAYCLCDMPEEMLIGMVKSQKFTYGETRSDDEIYDDLKTKHSYSHLPLEQRIRLYPFEYNPEYIKRLKSRVKMARRYLKNLAGKKERIEQDLFSHQYLNK